MIHAFCIISFNADVSDFMQVLRAGASRFRMQIVKMPEDLEKKETKLAFDFSFALLSHNSDLSYDLNTRSLSHSYSHIIQQFIIRENVCCLLC